MNVGITLKLREEETKALYNYLGSMSEAIVTDQGVSSKDYTLVETRIYSQLYDLFNGR